MSDTNSSPRRPAVLRAFLFLCGLAILCLSAAAYVWIQRPLGASIVLERQLAENVGRIMTLDEVLTMSARMAAAAGDSSYEARYNANVDELDRTIKSTLALVSDPEVARFVAATDAANLRLVDMETRSFELDKQGRHAEALKLLVSEAYRTDKEAYAGGMARAFARMQTIVAARRATVERWSVILQISAVLSLVVVIAAWALEQRERRRRAAAYAGELESTVRARTAELEQRNTGMRLVLDNVVQGFITIDTDGVMAKERSAVVDRWFGTPRQRDTLSGYLQSHAPTFAQSLDLGLDQIRDGLLPADVLVEQLPRRLRAGSRTFEVGYTPIYDGDAIQSLLVVVSDVTVAAERERLELEQREMVQIFHMLSGDRAGFLEFCEEARELADAVTGNTIDDLTTIRRLVHTLKGNAATFGIGSLADACHELEAAIEEQSARPTTEQLAELGGHFERFWTNLQTLQGQRACDTIDVKRADYEGVLQAARRGESSQQIARRLTAWKLEPTAVRLARISEQAQRIVRRINKGAVNVEIRDGGLRLDPKNWASFWSAFIHVVRNAVDHGIEQPAERASSGKPGPSIELATRVEQGRFIVAISDDGRGVDWDAIAARARIAGIPCSTAEELLEALFADGISTAPFVSHVSGRGVGMGAVRAETRSRGGEVHVSTASGVGTRIEFNFPLSAMGEGATARGVAA